MRQHVSPLAPLFLHRRPFKVRSEQRITLADIRKDGFDKMNWNFKFLGKSIDNYKNHLRNIFSEQKINFSKDLPIVPFFLEYFYLESGNGKWKVEGSRVEVVFYY